MKFREMIEKTLSILLAIAGIGIAIINLLPFGEQILSPEQIDSFSLLILATITVFVFMEIDRLHVIDNNAELLESIEKKMAKLDIDTITQELLHTRYAGIHLVHEKLPSDEFSSRLDKAKQINILNTWIPNLNDLIDSLIKAINNGAEVKILLLYPKSPIAELRNEALQSATNPVLLDNVQGGVENNLKALKYIFQKIEVDKRKNLQVKMFSSLPSISIYQADELALVSAFFHGRLAIHAPQFEVRESSSVLGQYIEKEFEILWDIGHSIINIEDWRKELDLMTGKI